MRVWILLFLTLLLTGCYDKTTCCLVDGGCDGSTEEDAAADSGSDATTDATPAG